MIVTVILGAFLLATIVGVIFVKTSPQFGGSYGEQIQAQYSLLDNYNNGKFVNEQPTKMNIEFWKMLSQFFKNDPHRSPNKDVVVDPVDSLSVASASDSLTRLTWFGHSAFLLEIEGQRILIDPMLGKVPAPHPLLGRMRYSSRLPIEIEQLPRIDAVVISHDHYDHLDYPSISKLKDKVNHFFVPLGVGSHLEAWGVSKTNIEELNWWETTALAHIELVCAPAQHFSGRGLTDRNATLWASWVIRGAAHNLYFSGDGGYGDHFKVIGEQYGPFDIALVECGQYNEQWQAIHMMPEETVQAAIDVNSKLLMPIHWGAFTLAFHSWTDPVERASAKASELNLPITTPKIGEPILIGNVVYPSEKWWQAYN